MLQYLLIVWFSIGLVTAGLEATAILYKRHPRQQHWHNMPVQYSRGVAYVTIILAEMAMGPLATIACLVLFARGRFNVKKEGCLPDGMGCMNPGCESCWESIHQVKRRNNSGVSHGR